MHKSSEKNVNQCTLERCDRIVVYGMNLGVESGVNAIMRTFFPCRCFLETSARELAL